MEPEREAMDAYLGKGSRRVATESSLLVSSSPWLNNVMIREILPIWLLRRNGRDFPVEADHTLGLSQAVYQVLPPAEIEALIAHERTINPSFNAYFEAGFVSTYRNEDFERYAPGTVGGVIGRQIRDFGFDLTLGTDATSQPRPASDFQYWQLRGRQTHDFEHILTGGQFNSIGEIVVIFARLASHATHLSPKLASAFNVYLLFTGFRMVSRALLHYPETWPKVLECVQQGIKVGQTSTPMWTWRYEDVFEMTPEAARAHFGVQNAYEVESERESAIFREDPEPLASAAE